MSEYKGIRGFKVQTLSTDPAASVISTGAWASGGAMNTASAQRGSSGILTAAMAASGQTGPGNVGTVNVEQYNGSAWTEINNVNVGRRAGMGFGSSQPVSMFIGGLTAPNPVTSVNNGVENFDGTNWTEVTELNTPRYYGGAAINGTNTAGLIFGGNDGTNPIGNTESWNGSAWTETTDLNTARTYLYGLGIQTSAIGAAGYTTATVTNVESWNGSSWTETTEVNQAKLYGGSAGTSTDGIIFGGQLPGATAQTEFWNGSSWTEVADLASANETIRGNGASSSVAWASGGDGFVTTTQEWTTSPPATFSKENLGQVYYNSTSNAFKVTKQSVPAGTWSSGGTMNTARNNMGAFGSTNSAQLIAGGSLPGSNSNATEKYNGTAWTTDPATLNTARNTLYGFGNSQDAGIVAGGYFPTYSTSTESYNGTSWTLVNSMNTARQGGEGGGTQTSAIYAKGDKGPYPYSTASESWDGTSWTTTPSTSVGTNSGGGAGTSNTSALVFGGDTYDGTPGSVPTRASTTSESWNGTSWTTTPSLNTGFLDGGGFGSATSAIKYGGANSAGTTLANVEYYNGTSWTEINDMADAARYINRGTTGSAISGLQCGGTTPSSTYGSATEEWTAGTVNSTITVS